MQSRKMFIDLLPYKPSIILTCKHTKKRVLQLAYKLLAEVIESIDDFYRARNFSCFDPHVGENLCQIRACQFFALLQDYESNQFIVKQSYSKERQLCKAKLLTLEELSQQEASNNEPINIVDFLESFKLNISLSETTAFLTISHFLTKFRIFNEHENTVIDYSSLIGDWQISKNLARRMVHEYQKYISETSSKFVAAKLPGCQQLDIDPDILRLLNFRDDDGRYTSPNFLATAILLDYLIKFKVSIFLSIRSDAGHEIIGLLFEVNKKSSGYVLSEVNGKSKHLPCIVMSAITKTSIRSQVDKAHFRQYLLNVGLIKTIMLNMAGHPQYSGKKLRPMANNPFIPLISSGNTKISSNAILLSQHFQKLKTLSTVIGCKQNDYRLLCIRHIYFDNLGNQLNMLKDNKFYSDILSEITEIA